MLLEPTSMAAMRNAWCAALRDLDLAAPNMRVCGMALKIGRRVGLMQDDYAETRNGGRLGCEAPSLGCRGWVEIHRPSFCTYPLRWSHMQTSASLTERFSSSAS